MILDKLWHGDINNSLKIYKTIKNKRDWMRKNIIKEEYGLRPTNQELNNLK
jgi:hypothetical protein